MKSWHRRGSKSLSRCLNRRVHTILSPKLPSRSQPETPLSSAILALSREDKGVSRWDRDGSFGDRMGWSLRLRQRDWLWLPLRCHDFIRDDLPLLVLFSPQQRQRRRMIPRRAQRKQGRIVISIFLLLGRPVSRRIRVLRRPLVAQKRTRQVVRHRHQRVSMFSRVFNHLQII